MFLKDRVEFSSKREYTDEGYLIAEAVIARTGIQEYYAAELGLDDRDPFEVIRVYRPSEEVFDVQSMASFANKPVTNNHPPEQVTAENFTEYAVGYSGDSVYKDQDRYVKARLFITQKDAIQEVESGKKELSNGYVSNLDWTPGVSPDGEKYDAVQRAIRGNHIAIVRRGRCGSACRVSDHSPKKSEGVMPKKVTIDGVDFEMSDQAVQAVGKLQSRLVDVENEAKKDKEEAEKSKADLEKEKKDREEEKEKMKTDHDKAVKSLEDKVKATGDRIPTPQTLDTLVENRLKTRDAALAIKQDFSVEGKDCETIRKEIVGEFCEDVDLKTATADYIRARFDALATSKTNTVDGALANIHRHRDTGKEEGSQVVSADEARQRAIQRNRDAWKRNTGGGKA